MEGVLGALLPRDHGPGIVSEQTVRRLD